MRYRATTAFAGLPLTLQAAGGTMPGAAVDSADLVRCTVQAVVTGSPVGSLVVQASNDNVTGATADKAAAAATNWTAIPGAAVAVNGAGTYLIPVVELAYRAIRVAYVPTSGTGTLTSCQLDGIGW